MAAYNGVTEAVSWLLANGARADAADCYNVSALMKAAYFGHAPTVRALLDHGADSGAVDMYGAGALAKASYRGHTAVVRLLLSAGARTDGEDLYGNRPLHSAVASGHRNIAMLLLQYGARKIEAAPSPPDLRWQGSRAHRRASGMDSPGGAATSGAHAMSPPMGLPTLLAMGGW